MPGRGYINDIKGGKNKERWSVYLTKLLVDAIPVWARPLKNTGASVKSIGSGPSLKKETLPEP